MVQEPASESEALLRYACFEALDMGCYGTLTSCFLCEHRSGCNLYFIHDAICSKIGMNYDDWNEFKNWAKKWRQEHLDLVKTKF